MKHSLSVIFFALCTLSAQIAAAQDSLSTINLDAVILDIYNAASELGETDFEQLQADLYELHETPIDLNRTSDEELSQLRFLSPRQIDDILAYADKHPFESLYELRLIPSLADYEIRDLQPFVKDPKDSKDLKDPAPLYAREVFAKAQHEIITRMDARNIEAFEGTDPVYVQTRYRFDYQRKVIFGAQLRRPAGGLARDLQYGAYIQLRDIAPHLHTLVAGNYQASFGQGLVLAPAFHAGKSMYVSTAGQNTQGLRYYSSVDGEGLHGAGTTLRFEWGKQTRLDASLLYSMKRTNDSVWHHLVGANLSLRHKRFELQLTGVENIWSDSIHPYRDMQYNRHYFRGTRQAVAGLSVRYNHGWFDLFGEAAAAQNQETVYPEIPAYDITAPIIEYDLDTITKPHWGFGVIAGSRFYPADGVSLIALYRYYSPYFDNALGYAFSETSRLGDENGGYLGFDITRWRNWRLSGYGDVFYFSGPKYGIPDYPSLGYDAMLETQYIRQTWRLSLRLRARQKGSASTYSARAQFDWQSGSWSLRTTADANLSGQPLAISNQPYGISVAQDIAYDFTPYTVHHTPLSLRFRLQAFDAREWANRIYLYEHDVLYAFSIPATYGLGGRAYLCLRWQIIPQLTLYFRASETVYAKKWAASHSRPVTRTDLHLLLRAKI